MKPTIANKETTAEPTNAVILRIILNPVLESTGDKSKAASGLLSVLDFFFTSLLYKRAYNTVKCLSQTDVQILKPIPAYPHDNGMRDVFNMREIPFP